MRHPILLALALALAACTGGVENDPSTDAGTNGGTDAGTNEQPDAGSEPGPTVPLEGFGAISGDCGVLDTELTSDSPHMFRNTLDFGDDAYDEADETKLTDDSERMANTPNAGGSSLLSEVFSLEVIARCELGKLLKTETEIGYTPTSSKKTDYVAEIDGKRIGVSVTRAMTFDASDYTLAAAQSLLAKKLTAINESSANVNAGDKWEKQILSVIAESEQHATVFEQAWNEADASAKSDTILIVTVTDGSDTPIYSNGN